jgi:uncharacterized protein involved in exopolysaccharide biosynthesis
MEPETPEVRERKNVTALGANEDAEISLIDLFAVLWHRKAMIIAITLVAMIGVVAFSVVSLLLPPEKSFLPNVYTPAAHMLINNASSAGGNLSSMLSSGGLGGLASLIGLGSAGSTYSQLALYLMETNSMLDAVVDEFDLINKYKIKIEKSPRAASREILKKVLKAEFDSGSGVFSVSFTDKDPVFAQSVINFCVAYLEQRFDEMGIDKNKREKENLEINIGNTYREIQNLEQQSRQLEQSAMRGGISSIALELNRIELELGAQRQVYTQLKVQYELLKISMASETPVFQVLEYAEVPDRKSGPSRGMLCIIVTFGAGFFAVFLAFVLNALSNIKKDPVAMAKLRSLNREE